MFRFWACSSFKTLVSEASEEETAAKEVSDAKAEAEAAAAAAAAAAAKREEEAKQAELDAAKSMQVSFKTVCFSPQVLHAGVDVWFIFPVGLLCCCDTLSTRIYVAIKSPPGFPERIFWCAFTER